MVSILQALAADARLLIMDEPTASLSDTERAMVFNTIRRLREPTARRSCSFRTFSTKSWSFAKT